MIERLAVEIAAEIVPLRYYCTKCGSASSTALHSRAAACPYEAELVPSKERDAIEAAIESERSRARAVLDLLGPITACPNCDGSGKNAQGDCCRIPGHARGCICVLCQWKDATYQLEGELVRARADMERLTNLRNQFVELLCEDRAADPPDELLISRLKTLHDDVNSAPTFADVAELVEALRGLRSAPISGDYDTMVMIETCKLRADAALAKHSDANKTGKQDTP